MRRDPTWRNKPGPPDEEPFTEARRRKSYIGCERSGGERGKGEMITMAGATEFFPLGALDIAGLHDGFRGELLSPQDPGYEDARRGWKGAIDRFPALIARCAGVADLIAAVMFAKDNGLLVAVRGGGTATPASQFVTEGSSSTFR